MISLNLIVCATKSNGIGQAGRLPWRLKEDMNFFKFVTTLAPPNHANVVIMGRKTWLSIPAKFRPLANRINIVVSRQHVDPPELGIDQGQDSYLVNSIDSACQLIHRLNSSSLDTHDDQHTPQQKVEERSNETTHKVGKSKPINKVFVIGGSEIYKTVLQSSEESNKIFKASNILITRILSDHPHIERNLDSFFPEFRSHHHWNKSQSLNEQRKFFLLPNSTTTTTSDAQNQAIKFCFDQLIVEGSFMYKFELWTNNS
ncbi:hypothetical protein PtB15_10B90 [Puccinia triticina]|nr:hypothetical protein PtB15_10B90 [Puccinia triticina]